MADDRHGRCGWLGDVRQLRLAVHARIRGKLTSMTGAWIFLLRHGCGSACQPSIEGRKIYAVSLPDFLPQGSVRSEACRDVFPFYQPLLYSSFIAGDCRRLLLMPMLGKTRTILDGFHCLLMPLRLAS